MQPYSRFAVYTAPRAGRLAAFGAAWLGWDAATGRTVAHPEVADLPGPVQALTAAPRKYGLHGTLKPPFRLAEGSDRAMLDADLAVLAARCAPVALDGLALRPLGRFVALVPEGPTDGLAALAATVVRGLDQHRAAATPDELARRRAGGLTPAEADNLQRWGYPYVMDAFRFHMTLTGPLPPEALTATVRALDPVFAPLLPRPYGIDDLCLFGEDRAGMLHLLRRFALTG